MTNQVTITLSEDEALVLYEFFVRGSEEDTFRLRNNAEFVAFARISAQLDKVLVQPFQSNYAELLARARERLAQGYEGAAPGVES